MADSNGGVPADWSQCDREPVQFPGAIMPHGAMLIVDPVEFRILGASANAAAGFGCGTVSLAGGNLGQIVTEETRQGMEKALSGLAGPSPPRYLGCFKALRCADRFDAFAHRTGDLLVLEFEAVPAGTEEPSPTDRLAEFAECIASLQAAETWQGGMSIAALELKRLTGFDSVIGVRLLADGSGHAVAEAREADFPEFLGKRFPRSDIPDPARKQMLLMPLQYAPELGYEAVPLVMAGQGPHPQQIDLGLSMLRSMSPMCSRYYLNMGSKSRLLLSLVSQGELWGFFSCLHTSPRRVTYSKRIAFQAFAQMAALLLVEKEKTEQQHRALQTKRRIAQAIAGLSASDSFPEIMHRLPAGLLEAMEVTGTALCWDNRVSCFGLVPPEAVINALLPWLDRQGEVFVTDRLPKLFQPAGEYRDRMTGLIAVRLLEPGEYLLGFRPEWLREVRWAGDPQKPMEVDASSGEWRLTPRGSFEVWKEMLRDTARPWLEHETEAMVDLQRMLILSQQSERTRLLSSLLERSNAELEAFAFIVSHDLQEPLRGIRNFSQFLRDGAGERLGPQETAWLNTIMKLSVRMASQIEALLQYSRAGQQSLQVSLVDLNRLVKTVLADLSTRLGETGTRVEIISPLPSLPCDPMRIASVFENLITNAIKYNDQAEKRIEIGHLENQATPTLFVRDNGIGISERHQQAVFTIFRRLHGRDEYGGGTGAGLTITRKHVERHGGHLWLESAPGQGSTFYFTLSPGLEMPANS